MAVEGHDHVDVTIVGTSPGQSFQKNIYLSNDMTCDGTKRLHNLVQTRSFV